MREDNKYQSMEVKMEIEIVITKKKLTKSIVNQMEMDTFKYLDMLPTGELLGEACERS